VCETREKGQRKEIGEWWGESKGGKGMNDVAGPLCALFTGSVCVRMPQQHCLSRSLSLCSFHRFSVCVRFHVCIYVFVCMYVETCIGLVCSSNAYILSNMCMNTRQFYVCLSVSVSVKVSVKVSVSVSVWCTRTSAHPACCIYTCAHTSSCASATK
jgi:hypothetical protein